VTPATRADCRARRIPASIREIAKLSIKRVRVASLRAIRADP
jgi:hypothetical protein